MREGETVTAAEAERAWWDAVDPAMNVWGLGGDGVEVCLAQILPLVPVGGYVLDLGCGPGRLAFPLAERGVNVVAVDSSPKMLALARRDPRAASVSFHLNDGRTLPVFAARFDVAYSVALFQHLPPDATAGYIAAAAQALTPGGRVRFQHVLGTTDVFLAHQIASPDVLGGWCEDAGLVVEALDVGLVHYQWCWVTAVAS